MTAFARVEQTGQWGNAIWELRSVNNRYLDVGMRLPEDLRALEPALREKAASRLSRGKLDCSLRVGTATESAPALQVNEALARQVVAATRSMAELAPDAAPPTLMELLRWPGVVESQPPDLEALQAAALRLLDNAFDELVAAREREGARIRDMLAQRLDEMAAITARVRERVPELVAQARQRLTTRLAELREQVDPERIEQEVVLLAQKSDVAEELDRLDAHVAEVRASLGGGKPVGRRLDFLMQELNREANTLGSKAIDGEVTTAAVELKVLIEQMREQVQNVE